MPAPSAFATVVDLEPRIPGGVPEDSLSRAQAALEDASAIIRVEAGPGVTWTTIDDVGETYRALIVAITCAAARRVLENADLVVSQALGDASITYGDASNDVFLKASEKRLVRRAAGRSALGYVDLSIGTPAWTGAVIAVDGQDEPIPFTYEPLRP